MTPTVPQSPGWKLPVRARAVCRGRRRRGFTLLELLIVITIMGLLAALTVPSLKNAQKSNALAASSQQIVDDVAFARRVAIKDRTTVLMVFLPSVKQADAGTYASLNTGERNVLLRGQQTSYALYSARQVGDQPGDSHPRYHRLWRQLPSGYFIPAWKFEGTGPTQVDATSSRENVVLNVPPFNWTTGNDIPVPYLNSPRRVLVSLPYIAFGPNGGLQVQNATGNFVPATDDEYIPLARGSIFLARDSNDEKRLLWEPADITERPDRNSINEYHIIVIDKLTGRTRVAKPEIK
jgi:prepilin-type N-terminal cleavage/methylation domain-containing protein